MQFSELQKPRDLDLATWDLVEVIYCCPYLVETYPHSKLDRNRKNFFVDVRTYTDVRTDSGTHAPEFSKSIGHRYGDDVKVRKMHKMLNLKTAKPCNSQLCVIVCNCRIYTTQHRTVPSILQTTAIAHAVYKGGVCSKLYTVYR